MEDTSNDGTAFAVAADNYNTEVVRTASSSMKRTCFYFGRG
jgi:hypothetical protein